MAVSAIIEKSKNCHISAWKFGMVRQTFFPVNLSVSAQVREYSGVSIVLNTCHFVWIGTYYSHFPVRHFATT